MQSTTKPTLLSLNAPQIEDLKLASSKMPGAKRRAFQSSMTLKYCRGNARLAERIFGWGRDTVQLGLKNNVPELFARERKRLATATSFEKKSILMTHKPCGGWWNRIASHQFSL